MAFDWLRGDLTYVLHAYMVDPKTLRATRGELRGVSGGKLSLDYYSDTKASASLETANAGDDGWDGSAAIQLVAEVYSQDRHSEYWTSLFTGYVKKLDVTDQNGMHTKKYELGSSLWAIEDDYLNGWCLAPTATAAKAITNLFAQVGRPLTLDNSVIGASRLMAQNTFLYYEPGMSRLEILYDLCDRAGLQPTVNGSGVVVVRKYVEPSLRGADFDAGADSTRGNVIAPIKTSDAMVELSSGAIVTSKQNDKFVSGVAERTGNRAAASVRGYRKMEKSNVNNLEPFTNAKAAAEATALLKRDVAEREMSHSLMFQPLEVGAIENFWQGNRSSKWLVKSADLNMGQGAWIWDLDLKGGW